VASSRLRGGEREDAPAAQPVSTSYAG
jgi:hypothetical protein